MRRQRTKLGAVITLSVSLALVGCRGSDDDDAGGDEITTEEGTEAPSATEPPEETGAPADTGGTATTAEDTDSTTDTAAGGQGATAPEVECPAEEQGLTDTEMVLGGTYPLSGPVAAYAAVPVGIKAWFDHLNAEGGITSGDGVTRQVTWNYLDDQYSPPATLENVRRLVEADGSWLILNPLGTPSNTAIRDYMNEAEVPQLYVATGAATWGRDIEQYPWTIGYQPDYESEGIAYAQYALEENPNATVAILHANDDFGKDYLAGIREGMGDAADQIVATVTYETTDATVDAQVAQALESDPDVFMLIATPQFAIQGINQTQALGYEGTKILTSVSSSVGAVIANTNDGAAEGWITSVYLKDPTDPAYDDDPGMVEYQEILAEYAPDANPDDALHLYGMSVAQLFQHTLESMPTVCRAAIMEAAKNLDWPEPPLLLPGIGIETSEGDGFPIQQVQLQRWEGDGYVKFGDIIDASDINAD